MLQRRSLGGGTFAKYCSTHTNDAGVRKSFQNFGQYQKYRDQIRLLVIRSCAHKAIPYPASMTHFSTHGLSRNKFTICLRRGGRFREPLYNESLCFKLLWKIVEAPGVLLGPGDKKMGTLYLNRLSGQNLWVILGPGLGTPLFGPEPNLASRLSPSWQTNTAGGKSEHIPYWHICSTTLWHHFRWVPLELAVLVCSALNDWVVHTLVWAARTFARCCWLVSSISLAEFHRL